MSDTNELKTTRIDGSTDDGVDLAAKFPNFEAAMRTIFGVPADTAMSEAMQIAAGGNVVMTGTLTGSAEPTVDLEAAVKSYVQSHSSDLGAVRCRAYLTSNINHSIPPSTLYIPWDAADIDEVGDNNGTVWDIANPSRLTLPSPSSGGGYIVGFSFSLLGTTTTNFWLSVWRNRQSAESQTMIYEYQAETGEVGVSGLLYVTNCSTTDFFELKYEPLAGSNPATIYAANTTFWLFGLGV